MRRLTLVFVLIFAALALRTAGAVPLDRYEADIRAFEARDAVTPPPAHSTLFVGSSTFTRWRALEQDFAAFHAINRGFGGSTIPEITHYADRIVVHYRPDAIVFYAGTNDIADGHSPQQVTDDFLAFVSHVRGALPKVRIIFIAMSVAPSRVRWMAEFREGNRRIAAACREHGVTFLDLTSRVQDDRGMPRRELFGDDALHMNEAGYARWIGPIREALADH